MNRTAKVAISLPRDLLRQVERIRRKRGETRSAFIRGAVRQALALRLPADWDWQYVEAYRRQPETAEEQAGWDKLAAELWAAEPWE